MRPVGLSQDSLEDAVRAAGVRVPPVHFDAVGSTNDEAKRLAAEGAPEWTVVATDHQTAGRGRLGRGWITPPGRALTFSVLLRPPIPPADAPILSLLAAAEMAESCREAAGVRVVCKWPNDLLIGERKVGGLLAEALVEGGALGSLVVGIGVNVATERGEFPPDLAGTASSLALEGGVTTPGPLLERFLRRFRARYRPGDEGFVAEAIETYRSLCATLGLRVRALTTAGETVTGTAVDVDEHGGLVLDRGRVAFGEVQHLGS